MAKKPKVDVRKPTPAVAEFMKGGDAPAAAPGEPGPLMYLRQPGKTTRVQRTDGRDLRRLTLYLPTPLFMRLRTYCLAENLRASDVISEAVEAWLRDRGV